MAHIDEDRDDVPAEEREQSELPSQALFGKAHTEEVLRRATRAAMAMGLSPRDAAEVAHDTMTEAWEHYRGERAASFETYFFGPPGVSGLLGWRVTDRKRQLARRLPNNSKSYEAAAGEESVRSAALLKRPLDVSLDQDAESREGPNVEDQWWRDGGRLQQVAPHPWPEQPDLPVDPEYRDGLGWVLAYRVPPPEEIREMYEYNMRGGLTRLEAIRLDLAERGTPVKAIAKLHGVAYQTIQISLRAARRKRASGASAPTPYPWIAAEDADANGVP